MPEIQLFRERKNLFDVEQLLKTKKSDYSDKRQILKEKWASLHSDELTFKNNFIRFNGFMLSNVDKRKRANNNIEYQKHVRIHKEKDIANIQAEIYTLQNCKIELDEQLKKYKCYKVLFTIRIYLKLKT